MVRGLASQVTFDLRFPANSTKNIPGIEDLVMINFA